jgi:hypothetical protein
MNGNLLQSSERNKMKTLGKVNSVKGNPMRRITVVLVCAMIAPLAFAQTKSTKTEQTTTTQPATTGKATTYTAGVVTIYQPGKTSAQNASIRGLVKNMDGKPFAGAQVKIERTDGKTRPINTYADASGNYIVNGLPVGTFKVAAYSKTNAKELGGVNTKSGSPVTVDLNLSRKSNNKLEKHYVLVGGETGSGIGGQWVEGDQKGPGMNTIVKLNHEGAVKQFEVYNHPMHAP